MKTSTKTRHFQKPKTDAEGGSMHAKRCCLWLKLQPPFSWTENSCSQVPLPKEEGEEAVAAAWSQHPPLPAHACIPERARCARQDALVTCGLATACHCWHLEAPGVEVRWDVGGVMSSVALGMKGHSSPASKAEMDSAVGCAWHHPPCNTQQS